MSETITLDTPRAYLPLLKPARYRGAWGGRGSGKSHFFAELLIEKALSEPGMRAVCVREVQKSLKDSVKRLIEDKINAMGVGSLFECQREMIKTPGDGVILFQGMQDHTADSIKSLENFTVAWIEEAQSMSARSLELLRPTIRAPGSELWFSWNPRLASDPVDMLLRGPSPPPGAIVRRVNYMDNPYFPAELEGEREFDARVKPTRYGHIWLGEYEPAAVGAIWDHLVIHRNRRAEAPEMSRIVVAIDPAVSSNANSDMHGIVVAGVGSDQRGYVLEDGSTRGTPNQWASRALALYDRWDADAIVIEVNQGGDMCRNVIESVRPGVRILEVHATRGKHVRAEPISALYHLDRVSHVGAFMELEAQMCQMTASGYEGDGSPDRTDALVWAMTELFPDVTTKKATAILPPPPVLTGRNAWMS